MIELHETSHWSVCLPSGFQINQQKAKYVFYTSKELIDRGNSMGVNGKEGLSKEIVKAIIGKEIL